MCSECWDEPVQIGNAGQPTSVGLYYNIWGTYGNEIRRLETQQGRI